VSETIEKMLTDMLGGGGFHETLGMVLEGYDLEAGTVTVRLPWQIGFERLPGTKQWHGGPIASFIDLVGDAALMLKKGAAIPTIDLRIDYLRPAIATDLIATGRIVRAGRTVGLADVEVKDTEGRLIAVGRGTYAMGG
jgi:uncharacterized protein (TIGR00369 family)